MDVIFRPGRPDDARTCGEIGYEAFKNIAERHGFPPDFPSPEVAIGLMSYLLSRPDVYSVVAERNGRIVGSNFMTVGGTIAGIGPITVEPTGQNGKVGRGLMDNVLEAARKRNFTGVRLVQAAYHGRSLSLYTKLGFVAREPLSIMQGDRLGIEMPGCAVRAARESDVATCNEVCHRVHGHDRGAELLESIGQGSATVVERAGRITGYATTFGIFGHAVGETNEDLKALIGAAPAFLGLGFLLPTRNTDVFRWCLNKGLRVVQPMTLMSVGLYNKPAGAFIPSIIF